LVLSSDGQCLSLVHNVGTIRAHALGAVNITIFRITDATTSFSLVPLVVVEGFSSLLTELTLLEVVSCNGSIRHILDILATTMARAVIRAGSSGASTAFITREAFAFTRVAVADTTVRAFSILVAAADVVGSIYPSDIVGANTLRTVTRKMR